METRIDTYVIDRWVSRDRGWRRTWLAASHEGGEAVKRCIVFWITFDACFKGESTDRFRGGIFPASNDVGIARVGIDSCWRSKINENENGKRDERKEFAERHIELRL